MILETPRLRLRHWRAADRDDFAALHSDPEVTADLGGPFNRTKSDKKLNRYIKAQTEQGYSRWVIETKDGDFLGYAGLMPVPGEHLLGLHTEIGWRLKRAAWGQGYASEAARAALEDGFARLGLTQILSYTAETNLRSQTVMSRIGMSRDNKKDFTAYYEGYGDWRGLVWSIGV
ncbi:MAG: GNAT family N-acetyltransferase [Hellea sp.]